MALTAAQISYIRDMSGDDTQDSSSAYEVSDATLQAIYDDSAQGNSDLDKTVVYVLRRRVGKAARLFGKSGELGYTEQQQQKFENLKGLLADWEARLGMTGGILRAGLLYHHLDYTDDDADADAESNE